MPKGKITPGWGGKVRGTMSLTWSLVPRSVVVALSPRLQLWRRKPALGRKRRLQVTPWCKQHDLNDPLRVMACTDGHGGCGTTGSVWHWGTARHLLLWHHF